MISNVSYQSSWFGRIFWNILYQDQPPFQCQLIEKIFSNEKGLLGGWGTFQRAPWSLNAAFYMRSRQYLVLLTREMEELKHKYLSGKCSTLCCLHNYRDPVPRELITFSFLFTSQLTLLDERLKFIKKKLSRSETQMYGNLWWWSGTLIYNKRYWLGAFYYSKEEYFIELSKFSQYKNSNRINKPSQWNYS